MKARNKSRCILFGLQEAHLSSLVIRCKTVNRKRTLPLLGQLLVGFGVWSLLIVAADAAPPADHTKDKHGYMHKPGLDDAYANHCTDCHAADLGGGLGPSCYQCHDQKWNGQPRDAEPPLDHTILKRGVALHKPGFGTPLANGCTTCHGSNLDNGFAPSCFTCHESLWAGGGTPSDHTELKGGVAYHRNGFEDPIGNGCTQCHGPNLDDGFAPSCYTCHSTPTGAHDFSQRSWLDPNDRACQPCHTWGDWNHTPTTTSGYTVSSSTLALIGDPDGVSAKCLDCHEGSVAVDDFVGTLSGTPAEFISGTAAFGSDLTVHHPVSFVFEPILSELHGGLYDPSITNSGFGNTIEMDMLRQGKVQCTTCHEVHTIGNNLGLVKGTSTDFSTLCFTCHRATPPAGMHHIPGRDTPWDAFRCTTCHGANLGGPTDGGLAGASACTSCHNNFVAPNAPPTGHHGGNRYDPSNECQSCHGATLQGASYSTLTTPGCNDCHGDLWLGNQPPNVDAGAPYRGPVNQSITLDASGTTDPDGDWLTFAWDFGDGSPPAPASPIPVVNHTYAAAGNYSATLTVRDGVRDPVVTPFNVEITNSAPPTGSDAWVINTTNPASRFTIAMENHAGVLVIIKYDGVNPPSLAIGMEYTGVVFWIDIVMDPLTGNIAWDSGPVFFGNIHRDSGRISGVVIGGPGGYGTFSGSAMP